MKKYSYLLGFLILAAVGACSGEKRDSAAEETVETVLPDKINEVTVMKLELTDFQHELISNGTLSARRHADLRFESPEPVAAIHVKNGDRVREGQPLAELATFRLANRTAQAKDALERAKLDLQDVLIGQGFALEDSSGVPPATMQLVRTRSGYNQALAQYDAALYEEQHAVLKAPFDGMVANLFSKPFNMASTAEAFCTLIDPRSLEASFTVLENELPMIREGDRVLVTPFALPGETTEGRISEINPLVDENGMVRVKASVAHAGKLFEGMKVRVSILRSLPRQYVIPKEAVVLRSGKQVVFTLEGDRALWVYVQTGLENASSYTVVDGLKEGDTVITGGNVNLAHESPVTVVR
ncbi:MAG: efflux RND transporter periplasmic adaptor subunit [Tannerella sp.]|jgi:RND family efflux transporter MFP subunit|nr:efflux RND transporter periplasmic adaptor subunit [Tannerella sp.]